MTEAKAPPKIDTSRLSFGDQWDMIRAEGRYYPADWIERVLGVTLTSDQRACADAIVEHQYCHWRAAHATGKTYLLAAVALCWGCCYDDAQIITTATVGRQVRRQLWGTMPLLFSRARNNGWPLPGEMQTLTWVISERAGAAGFSTNNVDAYTGDHGEHVLFLLDEGQGIEQEIVDGTETSMQSPSARCIFAGNPVRPEGAFYEAWKSGEWHCLKLAAERHPNIIEGREVIPGAITPEWIERMARVHGRTSPWYIGRVDGEFPENASWGLFNGAHLTAAVERWNPNLPPRGERRLAIDVAGMGDDLTVWAVGDAVAMRHIESAQIMNPLSVAVRGQKIAQDWNVTAENIYVDMTGEGHGTVAKFREMGMDVVGVHFGESADDKEQYANRRAEMYKGAANALDPAKGGEYAIPDHERLVTDCRAISYTFDGKGRYLIEPKDKIKKRTGTSPDFSDALALLFYPRREAWVF